jgi:flagellar basal-body rod modification protein FlgD
MTSINYSRNQVTLDALNRPVTSSQSQDENSPQALQERFLTLLMTQLKLQDPFNPMDNFQMTSQLAQLSTVEGIGKVNQTLQSVLEASQHNYLQSQSIVAAGLVGKKTLDAMYAETSPLFQVNKNNGVMAIGKSGDPATAATLLKGSAERLVIKIYDPNDVTKSNPIREISIANPKEGLVDVAWDGHNSQGEAVPPGNYQFQISLEKPISSDTEALALSWKNIEAVAFDDVNRPYLVLAGGRRLSMAELFQVKA